MNHVPIKLAVPAGDLPPLPALRELVDRCHGLSYVTLPDSTVHPDSTVLPDNTVLPSAVLPDSAVAPIAYCGPIAAVNENLNPASVPAAGAPDSVDHVDVNHVDVDDNADVDVVIIHAATLTTGEIVKTPPTGALAHNPAGMLTAANLGGRFGDIPGDTPVLVLRPHGCNLPGDWNHAVTIDCTSDHRMDPETLLQPLALAIANAARIGRHSHGDLEELSRERATLEKQNAQLRELCQTAQEFVDHIAHEFRTPLAVIKEFASIMRDEIAGPLTDEQQEYLDIIGARVDDLTLMINDMLDISKLEAGMLGLTRVCCAPDQIVRQAYATLARKAAVQQTALHVDIPDGLPDVFCDPDKICRVLTNLAANAIKYCDRDGQVTIRLVHDASRAELRFEIEDDGPGMDEDQLAELNERFAEENWESRSQMRHVDIGLSMAGDLVHLNFGEIRAESKLGIGSTFAFTVPEARPELYIKRYLSKIGQFRTGTDHVSIVRAVPCSLVSPDQFTEVEQFIQHHIRRTDLLFRRDDRSWLLLFASPSNELQSALSRIERAIHQANQSRPTGLLPIVKFSTRGSWRCRENAAEVTRVFREELSLVTAPA